MKTKEMEKEPQEKETERGNEYRGTQKDVANNVFKWSNMVMIRIHQSSFISFIGGEIATRSQNTDFIIYLFFPLPLKTLRSQCNECIGIELFNNT